MSRCTAAFPSPAAPRHGHSGDWLMNPLEDEQASELADLPHCNSSLGCSVALSPCQLELRSANGGKEFDATQGSGRHRGLT
jgi:hypothetical protein